MSLFVDYWLISWSVCNTFSFFCVILFEHFQLHVYLFIVIHKFELLIKYMFQLCKNVVAMLCKEIIIPFYNCITQSEYEHVNNVFIFSFTIRLYYYSEHPYTSVRICIFDIWWIRKLFLNMLPFSLCQCNIPYHQ